MRMSVACAMRQTWMSFSCVPVAMNLPSVLQLQRDVAAAPGEAARRQRGD